MNLKHLLLGQAICALSTPTMAATFVLVHGGFQSVADWHASVDALIAAGETDLQLAMLGRAEVQEVAPLDTGLVPQWTAPMALADAIRRAATPEIA